MMSAKTTWLWILCTAIVTAFAVVMVTVVFRQPAYVPDENTITVQDIADTGEDITTPPNMVGGSVQKGDTQTSNGLYYCTLTAQPEAGYTFAYWQNASTKLSGETSITLSATSTSQLNTAANGVVAIFVENTRVYEIANMADFNGIIVRDINNNATSGNIYKLTADINDFSTATSKITLTLGAFNGILDGNNHTISNIDISGSGIFESLSGAVIKNLVLSAGRITASTQYVGSFAPSIHDSLISHCISHLSVSTSASDGYAGGMIARCDSTTVRSMLFGCGFYGTVDATHNDQMIAKNTQLDANGSEACIVLRPKYEGANNTK